MKLTQSQIIIMSSLFFVIFDNITFFRKSYEVFNNMFYMIGLGGLLFIVLSLLFSIIFNKWTLKPILIILLLLSSIANYYMETYGTIINDNMLQNIIETNSDEVKDLLNLTLFLYLFLLGIIPSIIIYKTKIVYQPLKIEFLSRIKLIGFNIILIPVIYLLFSKYWVSFFRMHKPLRMYSNPAFYIYSVGKFIKHRYFTKPIKFKQIGTDATLLPQKKQKLIIFVLGEAGRYDHFSLNGYKRDTNPLLSKKKIINYPYFYSCGTETAVSLPCMFSPYNRDNYSNTVAKNSDSVIDVLARAGVNVIWRDNDSGSKGIASRIKKYHDFNTETIKPYCKNGNCIDDVLFYNLEKEIKEINNSNPIFIVLHTKGSHGPAYYKRYPKEFEKFKPVCKTNQLQNCKKEEVVNGYDNTILYTDYILNKTIKLLEKNSDKYSVAMYYMADHGESLGEKGIYLHGLPYFIAPDVQKHPASIVWFGDNFNINFNCAKQLSNNKYSHDNLFSTILGLVGVKTKVYNPKMDIFEKCREK